MRSQWHFLPTRSSMQLRESEVTERERVWEGVFPPPPLPGQGNFCILSLSVRGELTFLVECIYYKKHTIMWNNLPDSLRSLNSMEHFKSALKTYLFQKSLIS